jgi:hypothetical protein
MLEHLAEGFENVPALSREVGDLIDDLSPSVRTMPSTA